MHFAAFFPLMESVEHECFRHLGLRMLSRDEAGAVSWPRVHADCDYRAAVGFEDVLSVSLTIARLGEKSVTYSFDIRHGEQLAAEGSITAVCCRMAPNRPPQSIPIPANIREKLCQFAV
ncbi:MAG: acyl-CoA thioesterase [Pirellulales bacterium]|nr:acyl-CoA thioesterase [Pirellulales bacterium]